MIRSEISFWKNATRRDPCCDIGFMQDNITRLEIAYRLVDEACVSLYYEGNICDQ